jgi:transposase
MKHYFPEHEALMACERLANFILLPELKLLKTNNLDGRGIVFVAEKTSLFEVCPKCAKPSKSVYDRRRVKLKDAPLRGRVAFILAIKRRFMCKSCRKPFTEPIPGVGKGKRTTYRFQKSLAWACENFSSLRAVQKAYFCSARMVYKSFYEQIEKRRKTKKYPVPKKIGIDEHSIRKPKHKSTQYATVIVDHKGRRVYDLLEGRNMKELESGTRHMTGFENVEIATLDLSPTYRSFLKRKCPKAMLVADRFHVQRLFTKLVNRIRLKITGDKRTPINRVLLMDSFKLNWKLRKEVLTALPLHPELNEVYHYKEAMHRFYRIRGRSKARDALIKLLDRMAISRMERVKELRKVILNWREEILNYFLGGYSNGRVEGFNRKAKLLQRKAYGIKSFKNYRLRLLNDCDGRSSKR